MRLSFSITFLKKITDRNIPNLNFNYFLVPQPETQLPTQLEFFPLAFLGFCWLHVAAAQFPPLQLLAPSCCSLTVFSKVNTSEKPPTSFCDSFNDNLEN